MVETTLRDKVFDKQTKVRDMVFMLYIDLRPGRAVKIENASV